MKKDKRRKYPTNKEKCFDKHLQVVAGKNKKKEIKYKNGLKIMTWSWQAT